MSGQDIKIDSMGDFRKKLQAFGNDIAKNLAISFKDKLTISAKESVNAFYEEDYTPTKYKRKDQLKKSYHPYYTKQNIGWRYHGGVEFNTDSMKDVHHDSNEYILNISLLGIHGTTNIWVNPAHILNYVVKEREILFNSISENGSDVISNNAIMTARKSNGF